jgi:aspartyl-tRNA(Asn)/glutamyl-tRNA(Gln) amidotransferase subunit C
VASGKLTVSSQIRILISLVHGAATIGEADAMITEAQVEHVAQLARLALQSEEKQRLTAQLNAILTYMEQLNEVSTEGVEPTAHVLDLVNVFRDDTPQPTHSIAETLSNAPETAHHYFVVPRIIE